jgi:hypothetical protein
MGAITGCQCSRAKIDEASHIDVNTNNNNPPFSSNNNNNTNSNNNTNNNNLLINTPNYKQENPKSEMDSKNSKFNNSQEITIEKNSDMINIRNKKKIDSYDITNYPNDVISYINKIRTNPQKFIEDIAKSIKYITKEKNKIIYKNDLKVALNKGEESFINAINILKDTQPMNCLIYKNDIKIEVPNDENLIKDNIYFQNKIIELKKTKNLDYYFKDAIKDPYISVLLNIIDDVCDKNKGKKRKILLNREIKFIAIDCKIVNKKFCAYYTFSKE